MNRPLLRRGRTGSVLVKPHEEAIFDLDPDDWTETYVDSSEMGSSPVREFVRASDDLGFPSNAGGTDNDRKYRQNLRKVDDDGALSEPMYIISDDSEKSLTTRRQWAMWRAPVGGLFLVVALGVVLGIFGPILGLQLPVLF